MQDVWSQHHGPFPVRYRLPMSTGAMSQQPVRQAGHLIACALPRSFGHSQLVRWPAMHHCLALTAAHPLLPALWQRLLGMPL